MNLILLSFGHLVLDGRNLFDSRHFGCCLVGEENLKMVEWIVGPSRWNSTYVRVCL